LRVLDTHSGQLAEVPLPGVSGWTLAWGADGRHLFYGTEDDTQRPDRVWRHEVGAGMAGDALLLHEPDPTFRVTLSGAANGESVLIGCAASLSTEWFWLDARDVSAVPQVVVPREAGVEYVLEDGGDHWLALTNAGGRREFGLVRLPKRAGLSWEDARDVLPYDEGRHLTDLRPFAGHLVLLGREEGFTQVWVLPRTPDAEGGDEGYGAARRVPFAEESHTVMLGGNRVFGARQARLRFTSLTQPVEHLDLDLDTLDLTLLKTTPVPGYDASQYVAERVWVEAQDGERVPVSVVRRRDTPLPAPTLLYGYGSYGIPIDPAFSASRLPLLDRGWVWATAHIRGGSELGRRWYDAGRLTHKMNTFTDFVAAGEGLIRAASRGPGTITDCP